MKKTEFDVCKGCGEPIPKSQGNFCNNCLSKEVINNKKPEKREFNIPPEKIPLPPGAKRGESSFYKLLKKNEQE